MSKWTGNSLFPKLKVFDLKKDLENVLNTCLIDFKNV